MLDPRRQGLLSTRQSPQARDGQQKPPWHRDVRTVRILIQLVLVVGVVAILAFFLGNMITNMQRQNIGTDFGYLGQSAEFSIPGSSFDKSGSRFEAIMVGVGNTFRVAIAGMILATILGVLLGIARLSKNWLLSTGARLYVEFFRNIPLLVIIVFAYLAVFLQLPRIENAVEPFGLSVISVRGIHVPWYDAGGGFGGFLLILVAGVVGGYQVARWRAAKAAERGMSGHPLLWGWGTFLLTAVVGYAALGGPVTISVPGFEEELIAGGIRIGPEYAALLVALVLYTASHIAEITRGSIQAVPRGQHEAAIAVALSPYQRMRWIILPQAFRVAIPPLANQYLNLTKNSSLAVAVSYFELTKITNDIIGNGAPAPQSYALLMVIYLIISLIIAAISNVVNRRLALVER